jgi:tetratricopeptide (TPR) repeat protein
MRSVSLQHDRPETHLNLGNVLAELGQADWAIRAYEVAAELAPWHPLPHRMIAQVLRRQKHDLARAARHDAWADERRAALRDRQEGNAAPRDAHRDPAT